MIKEIQDKLQFLHDLTRFGSKFGLERMEQLLAALGEPQKKLKFIHIAGTNGKGSTSAFITSILASAGFRVGTYTSPHLVSYCERISINNVHISVDELAGLGDELRKILVNDNDSSYPTQFEVLTALALLYFARQNVDIVILEVGLGGRLDATNVITPEVAIITNIGLDHCEQLGNSIPEIAREKAGIIKLGCSVITAAQSGKGLEEIEEICRIKDVQLVKIGQDISYKIRNLPKLHVGSSVRGYVQSFDVSGMSDSYDDLKVQLIGEHQFINAATAVAAVEALQQKGWLISKNAIYEGVQHAKWPGRLEIIQEHPTILLDGAHNPDGVVQLKQTLDRLFSYERLILVIGIFMDKNYHEMLELLLPLAHKIVLTRPSSERGAEPEFLLKTIESFDFPVRYDEIKILREPGDAYEYAEERATNNDLVCVCGSLFLVGEIKLYLLEKHC